MKNENDECKSVEPLSDWDRTVIVFFMIILGCASIYYWFFWGDLWVPLLSIIGALILYNSSTNDVESMYKPIARSWNPLIEAAIVLMFLLTWIIIIFPWTSSNMGLSILGSFIFQFVLPYLMLVTYFRYSRQSVGLDLKRSKNDHFVYAICSIMLVSRLLMLLLSENGITLLLSNMSYLLTGIIYVGFLVGFVEEFIFRGIMQNRIALHFRSRVLGIILTSSLFAVIHVMAVMTGVDFTPMNVGSSLIYAFMTRLPLGIIMGIVWNNSENLIGVSLIHASNNIAFLIQSLIWL